MFATLKRMYDKEKIDKASLRVAVSDKGWISPAQYVEITGEQFE